VASWSEDFAPSSPHALSLSGRLPSLSDEHQLAAASPSCSSGGAAAAAAARFSSGGGGRLVDVARCDSFTAVAGSFASSLSTGGASSVVSGAAAAVVSSVVTAAAAAAATATVTAAAMAPVTTAAAVYPERSIYDSWTERKRYMLLGLMSFATFLVPFSDTVYLPSLSVIQRDLGTTPTLVSCGGACRGRGGGSGYARQLAAGVMGGAWDCRSAAAFGSNKTSELNRDQPTRCTSQKRRWRRPLLCICLWWG
jgi:hypothetical protein